MEWVSEKTRHAFEQIVLISRALKHRCKVIDSMRGRSADILVLQEEKGMSLSVKGEYQKRRKKQFVIAVTCIPVILLYLFLSQFENLSFIDDTMFTIILFFFLLSTVVFTLLNWRCPHCNSFLGKEINARRCPRCGIRLQSDDPAGKRK